MNPRWLLVAVAVLVLAPPVLSQEKKDKKELRWGTDPTGGAPYVYKDGDTFVGFEVELAEYLAKEIGRTSKMVTGDWDKLPELLGKPASDDGIDIVLNGYEFTEDMEKKYPSTVPYYVYKLGLIIHKDSAEHIEGWTDLNHERDENGKKRKTSVGVLGGSIAHNYMNGDSFGAKIDLKINPDVATVIGLVEQKRLDATVQDTPAALYYVKHGKGLKLADEPRKAGFYVILTRANDNELREQLNAAIKKAIKDGTLRKIYAKYGLWNEDQERLLYWTEQPWPPVDVEREEGETRKQVDWSKLLSELLKAAGMTIFLAAASFPIAMVIGMLVALGRVYGPALLRIPLGLYVEFLRGTPLLLQLYFVYYLLPQLVPGFDLTPIQAGILGLAINYSAYEAENYRAGLLAIPRGQMEAALALGMNPLTALRVVIVPQAVRIVIPPVTNDFIALFKDTSVCSVILITELTRKYNELYNFNRDYIIQLAFITAGLYLVMSYPLAIVARVLEKRLGSVGGTHR